MRKLIIVAVAVILGGGVGAWAHDDQMMMSRPSSAEFQQLKQLVGNWQGTMTHSEKDSSPEPVTTEFKLTAAGSTIEETLMRGTPHEMVDMYTDENGKLAMTHYCAIGNQPHLLLKKAGPAMISLQMGPTPGIDANKDPHMHALTLEFPDANHLIERWTSYANGQPGETALFTLARVK